MANHEERTVLLFWSGPRPVRKGFEGPRFPFEGDPIKGLVFRGMGRIGFAGCHVGP